jgi:hypothetical protein
MDRDGSRRFFEQLFAKGLSQGDRPSSAVETARSADPTQDIAERALGGRSPLRFRNFITTSPVVKEKYSKLPL